MGRGGDTLGAWSLSSGEKARVFVNQLGVKERSNLLMALKQTREGWHIRQCCGSKMALLALGLGLPTGFAYWSGTCQERGGRTR